MYYCIGNKIFSDCIFNKAGLINGFKIHFCIYVFGLEVSNLPLNITSKYCTVCFNANHIWFLVDILRFGVTFSLFLFILTTVSRNPEHGTLYEDG